MIGQLAQLQGISAGLAEQRQDQLEAQAAAAAAAAAQQQAEEEAAAAGADPHGAQPTPDRGTDSHRGADPDRRRRTPTAAPTPTLEPDAHPDPTPTADPRRLRRPRRAPPTSGDAAAAIAFARAQLGEPYKYGAAGPNSWDCSGLTMMAWQAGGKSLPHYSVGAVPAVDADLAEPAPAR